MNLFCLLKSDVYQLNHLCYVVIFYFKQWMMKRVQRVSDSTREIRLRESYRIVQFLGSRIIVPLLESDGIVLQILVQAVKQRIVFDRFKLYMWSMVFGSSFATGEFLLCILKNMYISVLLLSVSSHE